MARYLVRRRRTADTWMVWDREQRTPAVVDGKPLVHLTDVLTELAFSGLTGQLPRSRKRSNISVNSEWEVIYGGGAISTC
jgi:hypothetical protein